MGLGLCAGVLAFICVVTPTSMEWGTLQGSHKGHVETCRGPRDGFWGCFAKLQQASPHPPFTTQTGNGGGEGFQLQLRAEESHQGPFGAGLLLSRALRFHQEV